ncbi:MAG TPA: antibiotic biosynthesis monooxygenase [Reyranella sp.]|jgi:quinol monooxygenase YgiN|nr:antibiotic biosynthesis monooxygenase [Reyranella sp.]
MVDRRGVLVGAAGTAGILATEAVAQTSPAPATTPPESPYAVTYIEVEPAQADASRRLLARYQEALKDKGALEFTVLEQMGRPNHFVIVERWPSAKAREDNAASAPGRAFRSALTPLLIAPYDERLHFALSVGAPSVGLPSSGTTPATPAGLFVVTHVDIVPPKRDDGVAAVRTLAERSAGKAGNVRFDALVQASRLNHLTLVEAWTDTAAQEAHSAANATKSFRSTLGPMSGALYDERLYALLK